MTRPVNDFNSMFINQHVVEKYKSMELLPDGNRIDFLQLNIKRRITYATDR